MIHYYFKINIKDIAKFVLSIHIPVQMIKLLLKMVIGFQVRTWGKSMNVL